MKGQEQGRTIQQKDDSEWVVLLARLRDTGMPIAQMQRFAVMMRLGDAADIPYRRALMEDLKLKLLEQLQAIHLTLDLLRDKIDYYRSWEAEIKRDLYRTADNLVK